MVLKTSTAKRNYAMQGMAFYHGAVSSTGLIFDIEHSWLGRKPSKIVTEDSFNYIVSSLVFLNSIA